MKNFIVSSKTIKVPEEAIGSKLLNTGHVIFLGLSPQVKTRKARINKWDYIKLKRKQLTRQNKGNN